MSARSLVAVGTDLIQNAQGTAMVTIIVFGGTRFLGRRLVQRLAAEGVTVRVVVRHSDPADRALRATGLDQISVFGADVRDQAAVAAAVAGAHAVVNAVSAYVEKGGVTFEAAHEASTDRGGDLPAPTNRRTAEKGRSRTAKVVACRAATVLRPNRRRVMLASYWLERRTEQVLIPRLLAACRSHRRLA
jgi:NAD(P)-dependent dehydrogenase (short-subunit alcohol dehydrogenase family)